MVLRVQTLPSKMHYGGENWGKIGGRSGRILTPNELELTFWVPDYGAKFHQNRARIANVGAGGQTDRQMSVHPPTVAIFARF